MQAYSDPYHRGLRQQIFTLIQDTRRLLAEWEDSHPSVEERNRLLSQLDQMEQSATFPGMTWSQLSWLYQKVFELHEKGTQQPAPVAFESLPSLRGEVEGQSESPKGKKEDASVPVQPVPIGHHVLPPLPYAYDALEPHIDEKTMRLHHDKHHKSYVGSQQSRKDDGQGPEDRRF